MTALKKISWVLNHDEVEAFLDQALAVGTTGVAIAPITTRFCH